MREVMPVIQSSVIRADKVYRVLWTREGLRSCYIYALDLGLGFDHDVYKNRL